MNYLWVQVKSRRQRHGYGGRWVYALATSATDTTPSRLLSIVVNRDRRYETNSSLPSAAFGSVVDSSSTANRDRCVIRNMRRARQREQLATASEGVDSACADARDGSLTTAVPEPCPAPAPRPSTAAVEESGSFPPPALSGSSRCTASPEVPVHSWRRRESGCSLKQLMGYKV